MADSINLGGMFDKDNPWLVNQGGTKPEKPALSQEERARLLAGEVKTYALGYSNPAITGDEHTAYRNLLEKSHKSLVDLVGADEARRLEAGAAIEPEQLDNDDDTSTRLAYWESYFAGHAVEMTAGGHRIKIDFNNLSPEAQQAYIQQFDAIYGQTGDKDPMHYLTAMAAGSVMTPEQIAAVSTAKQEQQRIINEQNAERIRHQAARQEWQQKFAEEQARLKAERQAKLDEERRKAADAREAERQADRARSQADRDAAANRQNARDAQATADRDARAQAQQEARAAVAQRARDSLDRRRREIVAATAQRAATVLARTQVTLEHTPMPGGIGLMLIAIIFILFAIQPVNASGATRLQLMFEAFMGNVKLPTDTEDWQSGIADALGAGFAAGFKNVTGLNATASSTKSNTSSLTKQTAAGGAGVFPGLETQYGGVPGDMSLQLEMPYSLQSIHEAF